MICANGGGISEINPQNAATARVARLKGGWGEQSGLQSFATQAALALRSTLS
jgi:hypothetical protein